MKSKTYWLKYFILCFVLQYPIGLFVNAKDKTVNTISNQHAYVSFNENGTIKKCLFYSNRKIDSVSFRQDKFSGPSYEKITLKPDKVENAVFESTENGIRYELKYRLLNETLMIIASVANGSGENFSPASLTLRLGIDNYQDEFPRWRNIYFPTLLRIEKTHFWGYFMTPNGKILSITSPNAISSWEMGYERFDNFPHYVRSHRIFTTYLNLLHAESLRERFPQNKKTLAAGDKLIDTLYLSPLKSLDVLSSTVSFQSKAPAVEFNRYTLFPDEVTTGTIWSESPLKAVTLQPDGSKVLQDLKFEKTGKQLFKVKWSAPVDENRYIIKITNAAGKQTEAILYVRAQWSAYLKQARTSGLKYLPTTSANTEAYYPLYSYFLARKYFPNEQEDAIAEKVYNTIFPVLFDWKTKEMRETKHRLQNAGNMAAILADRFEVTKDTNNMHDAHGLLEFIIRNQGSDGGYYAAFNKANPTHYSCVNFVVKTMMEVLTQEQKLAQSNELWKERYNTALKSVQWALKDLLIRKDNLGTEGQHAFDDGMIACSSAQLALGALTTSDKNLREEFLKVALEMYHLHNCLTQQKIPDARMNGATLRFWESQFTINLMHNMLNSPCGWSARKIYATYYLYLLTGEKHFLYETMNALGSCSQLIDLKKGKLYFSFIPDPYIRDKQYLPATEGSRIPMLQDVTVCEQYLPLISDWHVAPYYAWRPGVFGIDNFVHEVLKCADEVAMNQGYVFENEDGTFETFNCKLEIVKGKLLIYPFESVVKGIHVNLKKNYQIAVFFDSKLPSEYLASKGMQWLGEMPENIKTLDFIK